MKPLILPSLWARQGWGLPWDSLCLCLSASQSDACPYLCTGLARALNSEQIRELRNPAVTDEMLLPHELPE